MTWAEVGAGDAAIMCTQMATPLLRFSHYFLKIDSQSGALGELLHFSCHKELVIQ